MTKPKLVTPEDALLNIADALVEDVLNATDEEIRAEVAELTPTELKELDGMRRQANAIVDESLPPGNKPH